MTAPGSGFGSTWICATETGGETQDGGPRSEEYPGSGAEFESSILILDGCFGTGESYLLENVSAVTFFLPGTWSTVNLNIKDFSLKFSSLKFSIYSKFWLFPKIASKGLWSRVRIRLSKPRTKNLHFVRP